MAKNRTKDTKNRVKGFAPRTVRGDSSRRWRGPGIRRWIIGGDDGMSGKWKVAIWAVVIVALGGILVTMLLRHRSEKSMSLKGAVIKQDTDTKKELPIADVQITAESGFSVGGGKSDSSGFFNLGLSPGVEPG